MPKDTFLNLEPTKRERFTEEALREFCLHNYQQASLTQIVKRLGIAKGSVYQYFENKADLYQYLFQLVAAKKAEYVEGKPLKPEEDLFEWIEALWLEGLRFDAENPLYSGFLFNIATEKDEIAQGIMDQNQAQANAYFGPLFEKLQAEGYLRQDIDLEFLIHHFTQSAQSIGLYMARKHEGDYRQLVQEGKPFMQVNREEMLHYVRQLTKILRAGITNR